MTSMPQGIDDDQPTRDPFSRADRLARLVAQTQEAIADTIALAEETARAAGAEEDQVAIAVNDVYHRLRNVLDLMVLEAVGTEWEGEQP